MAYMYYIQHNQNTLMKQNTKHKKNVNKIQQQR